MGMGASRKQRLGHPASSGLNLLMSEPRVGQKGFSVSMLHIEHKIMGYHSPSHGDFSTEMAVVVACAIIEAASMLFTISHLTAWSISCLPSYG